MSFSNTRKRSKADSLTVKYVLVWDKIICLQLNTDEKILCQTFEDFYVRNKLHYQLQ